MSGALLTPAGTQSSKPDKEINLADNPGKTNLTTKHSAELAIVQLNDPLTPATSSAMKFTTKKRRRSVNSNSDDVPSSPPDCNQSNRTPFPSPTKSKKRRQWRPRCSKGDIAATDVTLSSSFLRSKAQAPRCTKADTGLHPPSTTASPMEAKAKEKRASSRNAVVGETAQNGASGVHSSDASRTEYDDWMPPGIDSDDVLDGFRDATSSSSSSSSFRRSGVAEQPPVFHSPITSSCTAPNKSLDLAVTSSALPARFYSVPPPGGLGVHVSKALITAVHPGPLPRVAQEQTEKIIEKKIQSTLGSEVTRLVHEALSSHARQPAAPRATCRTPAVHAEDKTALFRKTHPLEERLSDERLIAIAREMPSTRNKRAPYAFTEKGRFRHEYRRLFVQARFSYEEAQRLFY